MKVDFDHQSPLSTNVSDHLPFDHLLTCCDFQRKLSNNQQPPSSEFRSIDIKSKDKNDSTCAQFHEEKIRSLLKIFPEVIERFPSFAPMQINRRRTFQKR